MRGRPILGVLSGFMFGLFLGISLFLWGVIPFHSMLLWILPIVGVALGLIMAAWAPFGRGGAVAEDAGIESDTMEPVSGTESDRTEEE